MRSFENNAWKEANASQEYFLLFSQHSPHGLVGSVQDLRTGGRWFDPQGRPIFFPRIDDSHLDKINSSLTPFPSTGET